MEGIIPFGKRSKRERKSLARQFNPGDTISGNVMEVKPDDKKVILYVEEFSGDDSEKSPKDAVKEYLDTQEKPASEKIELPEELTGAATEEEPASEEESDDKE